MSARPAVLITGAARRIGAALARYFAEAGYDIALHYHTSDAEAQALHDEIRLPGIRCELFRQDLTDIAAIPQLMEEVHKVMPHCPVLINNASVFERAGLMETDEALFDRQFATNLKAPFFLTQAFAKRFGPKLIHGGSVINMLDTDIVQPNISHFAYLLSKKALAEFTQMAARELGPNIRVNGICPGVVEVETEAEELYQEKLRSSLPLKSHPEVAEIAKTALWLVGQRHITGQLLFVDGGQHVI